LKNHISPIVSGCVYASLICVSARLESEGCEAAGVVVDYGAFKTAKSDFQSSDCRFTMKAVPKGITISPVNMDERVSLGLRVGDTVRVHQKIKDKDKIRLQVFEGLVLARKHGNEPGATFTVRRVASGVGMEKIFPLYSPIIDKLEIVRRAKVRRAKLYYIREKVAREVKRQMRRMSLADIATESETEAAARAAAEAKALEEAKIKEKEAVAAKEAETAETKKTSVSEAEAKAPEEPTPHPDGLASEEKK
jgi:large subunit ribosomal protein L19